ncbi:AraC family transcriptional regulator [Flagellimonas sp. S3867]|uniref:AraC family transcriptional regulator n=1 Tax=Flagellimonas sp. S3867 TaxID=2768063 RepID=UPI001686B9B6|nr:helix-turn-helix transcriptional regulator [Flagellimonas sp. S3867]
MTKIERYHLHKNDPSKLHFEVNNAQLYYKSNKSKASVPHRHSFYQLVWFKEKGRHYVDYEVINHEANSIFFINKNQVHYFCPDASNIGYLFHFNDEFINARDASLMDRFSISIFNEIGSYCLKLSATEATKLDGIVTSIQSELTSKESFYREQVYHYFQIILLLIERLRKKQHNIDFDSNADFGLAASFKKLVRERIDQFYSIDYYASALGTNSKTLTTISKRIFLATPAEVIRESKLLEAKRMLSNQKISIKEIAYALGFDDPTYFTKYFKKGIGHTPKEFQQSIL